MNLDEAKARAAAQNAELAGVMDLITAVASRNPTATLLAMIRAIVEMLCARDGQIFAVHYKLQFYKGVLRMLKGQGIE